MEKVIVVSGGTKGIGLAIVEKFAAQGYNIFICARHQADLDGIKAKLESPDCVIETFRADLADKNQVLGFAEFISQKTDTIEVLVNNAGTFIPGELTSEEDGIFEHLMYTNFYSAFYLTRGLLPLIKMNATGHIFNMCSVASKMAYPNGGSYCVSKFALYGFSQVLREELKEKGIRVTSILPGATYTASWEGADLPEGRFIKPEDVAEAVWSAFTMSPRSVVEEIVIRPQLGDI